MVIKGCLYCKIKASIQWESEKKIRTLIHEEISSETEPLFFQNVEYYNIYNKGSIKRLSI